MIPIKPKDVFWSDEQWSAIYECEKNILVNAGAGSGKTAVLTERLIQLLKKGISLENLIVLTFTKAAASEMKERIREKLIKEINNKNELLQPALDYLDQAAIQTFDGFALSLVKRYHYLLGVDRSINIGDKIVFTIKKKQIIDHVFDEYYEGDNKAFLELIDLFAIKNDNNIKKYIYEIDKRLELIADKNEYLNNYFNNYYSSEFINKSIKDFIDLFELEVKRIKERLINLKAHIDEEVLIEHIEDCEDTLGSLFSAKSYKDYISNLEVTLPQIPRKVDDEEQKYRVVFEKDNIKLVLKKLRDFPEYQDELEMFNEIVHTKKYAEIIIDIIRRIDVKFNDFKKRINSYEFLDISKLAIKLVKENSELREQIKASTYEILIDEYQDTSDIQEILISYLANNNVYMVGDIKQSIYRFRNANPDIFKDKYQNFKFENTGLAIDLSKNFRSREQVLNNINLIFSQIMSLEIGGVDYNDNHALLYGNKKYSSNTPNDNYDIEILTYNYENTILSNHEIEAFIVGNDILQKLENKFKIYDKDEDLIRDAKYSDFTVLATEKKQFDLYKKIFEYLQIPLVIHKDEDFVRSSEIYVIKNILRAVYSFSDNRFYHENFKDAIISVLRSFLVEASDQVISRIFHNDIQTGLKLHCPEIFDKLINIAGNLQNCTSSEILGQIYQSFQVYEKIIKLGNVEQIENKLNYLLIKFKEFDRLGFKLLDTIEYLQNVIETDLDIEFAANPKLDENVVHMMTIHKSKGLEFPVCYFPELDNRFNFSDIKDKVIFDKTYGIIIPTFKEGLKDTFYKSLVSQKYRIEEISERMRVLYVALSRAKEKMIVVTSNFEESYKYDDSLVSLVDRLNYKSLFQVLSSIKHSLSAYTKEVLIQGSKEYENKNNFIDLKKHNTEAIDLHQVSLIKKEVKKGIASLSTTGLLDKEIIQNMNFGNKIHKYFEVLDFTGDLNKQIKAIDCDELIKVKLMKFFDLDLFKKNKIINSYHEHSFSFQLNEEINGIIDLILETDKELLIIDYKLKNIDKAEYINQLSIYKRYLETVSPKQVHTYLYSILNEELRYVE